MKALSQLAKDIEIVDRMIRDDAIHVILQVCVVTSSIFLIITNQERMW